MTNKELIEKLLKLPQDAEVIVGVEDGDEMGGYIVPIKVFDPQLIVMKASDNGAGIFYEYNGGVGEKFVVIQTNESFVYRGMYAKDK